MAKSRTKKPELISEEMGAMQQRMADHEKENDRNFADINRQIIPLATKEGLAQMSRTMASKADLEGLASKKDVEDLIEIFKNLTTAARIIRGGTTGAWKILLGVASLYAVFRVLHGGVFEALNYLYTIATGK